MAKRKKGSVFDYEGFIPNTPTGPSSGISPTPSGPTGEVDDDFFSLDEAPQQPEEHKLSEDEWQSILEKGEPPKPDSEFEEDEPEQETFIPRRSRVKVNKLSDPEFLKKVEAAKANSKLVRNEILGYRSQEVIDEAVRRGAIVRKGNTWAIPYEVAMVKNTKGVMQETMVISENYTRFMEELDNNTLKIKHKNTLL